MKKTAMCILLISTMLASVLTGCGAKKEETQKNENTSSYKTAVEVLEAAWNGYAEADKFPVYGGEMLNPVDNAPGNVPIDNTDALTHNLLLPESLQGNVEEAASMIHFMNANTFTGVCVKVKDMDQDTFVNTLKDDILTRTYMCGFPEKILIISTGDYIVYAIGAEDIMTEFEQIATEKIEGAKVVVSQPFH